eukprot:gene13469-9639_t
MMTTVGERESAYTKDQVHRARAAREMQARLGHASGDALARTLANGSILNCPVPVQDIARAKGLTRHICMALSAGSHRRDSVSWTTSLNK